MAEQGGSVLATVSYPIAKRKLVWGGKEYPIKAVPAEVHFCNATGPMKFSIYEQTDDEGHCTLVQHAKATVGGKTFDFLFPDGVASEQIAVRIADAPQKG